jgi:hypothetical protein
MATVLHAQPDCKPHHHADGVPGFESIGDILRRLRLTRRELEQRICPRFDSALSLQIDAVVAAEDEWSSRR